MYASFKRIYNRKLLYFVKLKNTMQILINGLRVFNHVLFESDFENIKRLSFLVIKSETCLKLGVITVHISGGHKNCTSFCPLCSFCSKFILLKKYYVKPTHPLWIHIYNEYAIFEDL